MTSSAQRSELLAALTEGITDLTESSRWRRYLEVQSRFPSYSVNNAVLIARQRATATRVAGFGTWRRLQRVVRRGERAIWILAPIVGRRTDGDSEAEPSVRGFRFVPVFDVSQTDGADLPTVCEPLVGPDPSGCYRRLERAARSFGFTVQRELLDGGVRGDCNHARRRIRVADGLEGAQQVKTLAHELAHALLHERWEDRSVAELEAESTAFVVCRALGIDSGGYSFGYVATWAGGGAQAVAQVRASALRIQAGVARILGAATGPPSNRPAAGAAALTIETGSGATGRPKDERRVGRDDFSVRGVGPSGRRSGYPSSPS
jgi:hypothetical protein